MPTPTTNIEMAQDLIENTGLEKNEMRTYYIRSRESRSGVVLIPKNKKPQLGKKYQGGRHYQPMVALRRLSKLR